MPIYHKPVKEASLGNKTKEKEKRWELKPSRRTRTIQNGKTTEFFSSRINKHRGRDTATVGQAVKRKKKLKTQEGGIRELQNNGGKRKTFRHEAHLLNTRRTRMGKSQYQRRRDDS